MNPNKVMSWELLVRWSDDPSETINMAYELPNHITQDIEEYFRVIEENDNE